MTEHTRLTRRLTGAQSIAFGLVVLAVLVVLAGFAPVATAQEPDPLANNQTYNASSPLYSVDYAQETVYVGDGDGNVTALAAGNMSPIASANIDQKGNKIEAIESSEGLVYVGTKDGTLFVLDGDTLSVKNQTSLEYSDDTDRVIALAITEDYIYAGLEFLGLVKYAKSDLTREAGIVTDQLYDIAVSEDRVYSVHDSDDDPNIREYDRGLNGLNETTVQTRGRAVTPGPSDNIFVAVHDGDNDENSIREFDAYGLSQTNSYDYADGTEEILSLQLASDGYLYAGDQFNDVKRIRTNLTLQDTYSNHSDWVRDVDFGVDQLYTASSDTTSEQLDTDTVGKNRLEVTVTTPGGSGIRGATVEVIDDGSTVASGTTDSNGKLTVRPEMDDPNTVTVEASKRGEQDSKDVFHDPDPNAEPTTTSLELDLEPERYIEFETDSRLLNHSEVTDYTVTFVNNSGSFDVTDQADVNSTNTTIATVDEPNLQLIATGDKNISARVTIEANYTVNGTTYSDSDYIVVSEGNLEDIFILPPVWRFNAFLSNGNILSILVGTLAGIVGARWANSFAGVGLFVLVMLVGWFAGYATTGVALVAVFVGAWLGLNLAANIDYTVRQ